MVAAVTRAFTHRQKYRILVMHHAVILYGLDIVELVPLSRFPWATMSETKRFGILRRLSCAVKCACGCDTWAPLRDIDFDHVKEHVSGGLTAISNGAPLRRTPCHAEKSARAAVVTGKVTRTKRKLSVTTKHEDDSPVAGNTARPSRKWSWPTRPLRNPYFKKCFNGRVERRAQ